MSAVSQYRLKLAVCAPSDFSWHLSKRRFGSISEVAIQVRGKKDKICVREIPGS